MCIYRYINLFSIKEKNCVLWLGHASWSKLLSIYFVKKKIWNTFFFFLIIIFPAICICQFTASLHVYNTEFLQQLSLSHNAIVHLVCWLAGHNTIENSLHLKKRDPLLTFIWTLVVGFRERKERASSSLKCLHCSSCVSGLLIHHPCLTFSMIQFRVPLPETWSFFPFANPWHTSQLLGCSLGVWLANGCFQVRKKMGENRIGVSANKSQVQVLEISTNWLKIALSLPITLHSLEGYSWATKTLMNVWSFSLAKR